MSDIVERLRLSGTMVNSDAYTMCLEAADEIEKLRDRKFASMAAQAIVERLDLIQEELTIVHERIRKLGI